MPWSKKEKLAAAVERLAISKTDAEAWAWLVECLWPLVLAINFRILRGNQDLAEDAAQETFVRVFQYVRFEEFREKPGDFEFYARAMAGNVGRSYLSWILREPSYSQEPVEDLEGGDESVERALIGRDEIATLLAGLNPEEQKLALLLGDGASLGEIAEALGISYSNAAVRVHRLRQSQAKQLKTK